MWRPARVIDNRPVSDGSGWLVLEAVDDLPAAFDPGHVLGLGLRVAEHSLMRHAYTVSRGAPERRRFEHLYRVVTGGRMSPRLAVLAAGDEVFFHGPFHTPIQIEIHPDAEHIILVSTGAGIGPLFGYAEKALGEGEARPMTLFAGFREESHMCLVRELAGLRSSHPNFDWRFTLTRPSGDWTGLVGRVTQCVPEHVGGEALKKLHFHLVGNGEMVLLMEAALLLAGLSQDRVSIETYFNHTVRLDRDEVERLAARFKGVPL